MKTALTLSVPVYQCIFQYSNFDVSIDQCFSMTKEINNLLYLLVVIFPLDLDSFVNF